jgi:predicted kinase
MKEFFILIGPSGAGKSTYTRAVLNAVVCSADDFFTVEGEDGEIEYKFDPTFLGYAHQQCLAKVKRAFGNSVPLVILDNTNTKISEIAPYVTLAKESGYRVRFKLFSERDPDVLLARNLHGLDAESIATQLARIDTLVQQWPAEWPPFERV